MPLQEGEIVGPYRIVGQLGQGGMATVYKAYHQNLDRNVAIKMMHQGFLEDPSFLARFKREAQIVARLEHPHIVPVYDYNEYEGQPYLVMKFIEGGTLRDDSSKGTLPMKQILRIMSAVGSALTYAHERGIVHRDIKPSNIVIDTTNHPYVTDFGLARMLQAGESTLSQDMILGTPHYISPEQGKGVKELDARADIYSLGVVLYKLVVGQVPFSGDTPYAIIHDHIYTPLPLPSVVNPDVPPPVEAVLLKALAKDPNDRYSSAVGMVEAFREATQYEPGVAQPRASPKSVPATRKTISTAAGQKTPRMVSIPAPGATLVEPTPTLQRPRRNVWMLGGIGALLLICLFSTLIVLNMVRNIAQLQTLSSENIASSGEQLSQIPAYEIPSISVEEAQSALAQQQGNPVAHLSLARALWADERPDEAQVAINDGLELVNDTISYLVNAARLAKQAEQRDAANMFYVQALNRSAENESMYQAVRAEAGAYLYQVGSEVARMSLRQANQLVNRIPSGQVPVARAMIARVLLNGGHPLLAQGLLSDLLAEDDGLAETHLVLGELRVAQGDTAQAVAEWTLAVESADAPEWVRQRAQDLIEQSRGA